MATGDKSVVNLGGNALTATELATGKRALLVAQADVSGNTYTPLTHLSGTKSSSGDNALVAAPGAGSRLVVCAFQMQNESSTATTMILKGGSAELWRVRGQNQGDGVAIVLPKGSEFRLAENAALNMNLSGANSCGYSVAYYTEAV